MERGRGGADRERERDGEKKGETKMKGRPTISRLTVLLFFGEDDGDGAGERELQRGSDVRVINNSKTIPPLR